MAAEARIVTRQSGTEPRITRRLNEALRTFRQRLTGLTPQDDPESGQLKDLSREWSELKALAKTDVKKPVVPVVANVLAQPIDDPKEIVKRLVEQVTGTVRWRECVAWMAGQGVGTFYELGSGKVLTGLLRRIAEGAEGVAVGTPDDIAAYRARAGA